MVIASPWSRLVASLIDGLILVPLSFLLMALAGINPLAQTTTFVQDLLFNWIPSWAYYVIFTALYGATPGKMALGLKVVRTDGQPVDWLTAFMREVVGKTLSTLPSSLATSGLSSTLSARPGMTSSPTPWWCAQAQPVPDPKREPRKPGKAVETPAPLYVYVKGASPD